MPSEAERPPELLRADKEQLDRAAQILANDDQGLVLLVCPEVLMTAAKAHMSHQAGVEIPEPVVLQGSEEAFAALVDADVATGRVRSLALGDERSGALRALNWHREKLLKGAPVVLWLDGVDELTEMREAAPDAYSFRDMVVLVRGDGGRLPLIPNTNSRGIVEARRRLARAKTAFERAEAHEYLSVALRIHGFPSEAESVARRGLEMLPDSKRHTSEAKVARAELYCQMAMAASERGAVARQRRATLVGLREVQGIDSTQAQLACAWLLAVVPGPFGRCDRESSQEALAQARKLQMTPSLRSQAARSVSWIVTGLGDMVRARAMLSEAAQPGLSDINVSLIEADLGKVEQASGRFFEAESHYKRSFAIRKRERASSAMLAYASAMCWLERGELDVSRKVVDDLLSAEEPAHKGYRLQMFAQHALQSGAVEPAQAITRSYLNEVARFGMDGAYLRGCEALGHIVCRACDARRVELADAIRASSELDVAQDVSMSLTEGDPPIWYPIRFFALRADLLIRTDRRNEALDLARRALTLARNTYPDLIPEAGRALADHILRATPTGETKPDDALSILADIEPEAEARGMLKELGRIRAARVLALVSKSEAAATIELAMAALRDALERTGAPRIKAETLLELAIRLPPATTLPDPLALASETHALYVEMPMPANEARSLELSGDVLAARGDVDRAKRRYTTAKAILERRGLLLRVPLISTKIERLS